MTRSLIALVALFALACKGPEGPAGAQGPQGEDGPPGEPGVDGSDGDDGTNGTDGDKGDDGDDGADGNDGQDGMDGETVNTIAADETWSTDVTVNGIWYVESGVTVTIDPGVTVSFLPGSGLVVDGVLDAGGTVGNGVTFDLAFGLSSGSSGVMIAGTGDASDLDFVTTDGVDIRLEGDVTDSLDGGTFSNSTLTVIGRTTAMTVDGATFSGNLQDSQHAIIVRDTPAFTLSNTDISQVQYGIVFDGLVDGATLTVDTLSVTDSTRGISIGQTGNTSSILVANDLTFSNLFNTGATMANTTATITGTNTATDIGTNALNADKDSDLTVSNLTVTGAGATAVFSNGALTADNLDISDVIGTGVQSGYMGGSVTNSDISDVTTYGVYGLGGDITVTNTTIDNPFVHGVYSVDADITATGVTVTNSHNMGLYSNNGDLTATDVTITGTLNNGLYSWDGDIVADDVDLDDIGNIGIYANQGDVTLTGTTTRSTIDNTVNFGIYAFVGNVSISNSDIADTFSHGIFAFEGGVTATNVTVSRSDNIGIFANIGNGQVLDLDNVTVTDTLSYGVYGLRTAVDATNVTIDGAGNHGIYTVNAPQTLTDVDIIDSAGTGVLSVTGDVTATRLTITDPVGTGMLMNPGVTGSTLSDVEITGAGLRGIDNRGAPITVTETLVDGSGTQGFLSDTTTTITMSTFTNNDIGIQVNSSDPSSVSSSVMSGNRLGFFGLFNAGYTDVVGNNVIGNSSIGVWRASLVDGNYIADNNGGTTVASGDNGTVDEAWTSTGGTPTQYSQCDSHVNASATELTGVGKTPPN